MNWDAIGAVGQLTGSIIMAITVVYSAVQIRQNLKAMNSASINQSHAAVTAVLTGVSASTDAFSIYFRGMNAPDTLTLEERVRFEMVFFQILRTTETIFRAHQSGMLDQELWDAQWRSTRIALDTKGGLAFWSHRKQMLAKSFTDWVDAELRRQPSRHQATYAGPGT